MDNTEATINLFEEIPYSVVATYKDTGKPIPGATINNLKWVSSRPIGEFLPSANPNSIIFKPSKAGTTQISANAVIGNIVLI
jgi:hypothetical protein